MFNISREKLSGLLRVLIVFLIWGVSIEGNSIEPVSPEMGENIVLLGNGLGSRMVEYGYFEAEIYARYPEYQLSVRNMCDDGDTPGFRPHSGRPSPWAFPGAEKFHPPLSGEKDRWGSGHTGVGDYESPDEWLTRLEADTIIAFFGFNESFSGSAGLENFRAELSAFIRHTQSRNYNGESAPRLVLVSPLAFENLSHLHGTPDGLIENANLALYTAAMESVAADEGIGFINLFGPSQEWFENSEEPWTRDGVILREWAYAKLAPFLAESIFGRQPSALGEDDKSRLLDAVQEKNWVWHNLYKIPNGVHVFGRRHRPFGPMNYPDELKKLNEMVSNRESAIWGILEKREFDLADADSRTHQLPTIETNYRPSGKNGSPQYKYGDEVLETMSVPSGYQIELFASEREFPNLANPVQMAFDNAGRLWVSTMPSYPHYQPGDPRPQDKILIYEDIDNDGKADREIVFAGDLHLPTGFEISHDGVYVAQGTRLIFLQDTDGDDRADVRETILSGFDDHDTHHVISAFCADPSGAIFMGEGTFLHSNVETAYGPVRSSNGGFFRFDPRRRHLERSARLSIPNPWGTAFDEWGQIFFLDTSDPNMRWMVPGTARVPYGSFSPNPPSLVENAQRVRPTSGLEIVSSRHFPDDVQGDILLHNTIGFLGTKQHTLADDGTGYTSRFRQDLLKGSDGNFRPVDLEFAPDGSLYLVDWHNVLVGHMQHSARDPLRDHVHGRIYRITYPSRPLVKPAQIAGAPISTLLENLKVPEYRTRYRTRRELRGRSPEDVLPRLNSWVNNLDASDPRFDHHLVEALWVTWGFDRVDAGLLRQVLGASDFRARAAGVRAIRYNAHRLPDSRNLLKAMASDSHGRVRMEVILAASWLTSDEGLEILDIASARPLDDWIKPVFDTALATLTGESPTLVPDKESGEVISNLAQLKGEARRLYTLGKEVYHREGHCVTCHQPDGMGLPAAQFPPLSGTEWVLGDQERLVKLTLHGLLGPIEVKGVKYPGLVPMTAFKGLSNEEIAAVLTYVRNSFGNSADPVLPQKVSLVRQKTGSRKSFYSPAELETNPE